MGLEPLGSWRVSAIGYLFDAESEWHFGVAPNLGLVYGKQAL